MKSVKKNLSYLLLLGMVPSIALADCPDGKYTCPNTGEQITYGNCWQWKSFSCQPCSDNYKNKCSNYSEWMTKSQKVQNNSLMNITIPGAHDAAMGKINYCSDYANDKVTKTQNLSFTEMLNSGTRYFDIRPIKGKNGTIYSGHYDWIGQNINLGIHNFTLRNEGCMGYSIDEILTQVKNFVSQSNLKEIVILKMSHFMDFKKYDIKGSHFDKQDFEELKNKVVSTLGDYLIKNNTSFINTPIKELTQNGSKVIVTFDENGYNGEDGIYSQNYLNLYDKYSNTNNFNNMEETQFERMTKNADSSYFLLSWTLTQSEKQAIGCGLPVNIGKAFGYGCKPIKSLATTANNNINDILKEVEKTKKYPNIIYTDFISTKETTLSVQINNLR